MPTPSTPRISSGQPRLEYDLGLAHELDERPDDPTLRQVAKHLILPEGAVDSLWPRVRQRLTMLGIQFDRWQQGLAQAVLALDSDRCFAATVGGVVASIPRQVGKSYFVSRLLVALCIEIPGLRCIWTSHHGRTTTNTFRGVAGLVQTAALRPYMKAGPTHGVRSTNGEQEVVFANGSIIQFGARESGFGRGMDAVDIMVFDEAQILGLKALEDMVPATNAARNPHRGLVIYVGTPPRPTDDGEAFRAKRKAALTGVSRSSVYVEIAGRADLPLHGDRQYRTANPSYPLRVPLVSMQRMAENLPDEGAWRREALGIWDEIDEAENILPAWDDCVSSGPDSSQRPVAYGVDRSTLHGVLVVAAWHMPDECVHIEEVWSGPSLEGAADFLAEAARVRDPIYVDAMSSAGPIAQLLMARKRKALKTSTSEFIGACALLEEAVSSGKLTHDGNAELAAAAKTAVRREIKRTVGTGGGWAWGRPSDDAPTHKLIAASLAVLGARRRKPVDPARPGRRTTSRRGRTTR